VPAEPRSPEESVVEAGVAKRRPAREARARERNFREPRGREVRESREPRLVEPHRAARIHLRELRVPGEGHVFEVRARPEPRSAEPGVTREPRLLEAGQAGDHHTFEAGIAEEAHALEHEVAHLAPPQVHVVECEVLQVQGRSGPEARRGPPQARKQEPPEVRLPRPLVAPPVAELGEDLADAVLAPGGVAVGQLGEIGQRGQPGGVLVGQQARGDAGVHRFRRCRRHEQLRGPVPAEEQPRRDSAGHGADQRQDRERCDRGHAGIVPAGTAWRNRFKVDP
jgi:hypothetical protein